MTLSNSSKKRILVRIHRRVQNYSNLVCKLGVELDFQADVSLLITVPSFRKNILKMGLNQRLVQCKSKEKQAQSNKHVSILVSPMLLWHK